MSERLNVRLSKSRVPKGTEGSNPSLSAGEDNGFDFILVGN